eukprot:158836-Prymnesium_polylepis.3
MQPQCGAARYASRREGRLICSSASVPCPSLPLASESAAGIKLWGVVRAHAGGLSSWYVLCRSDCVLHRPYFAVFSSLIPDIANESH